MIELHIMSNNRRDLEDSRDKCFKALDGAIENFDALITDIILTSDDRYAIKGVSSLKAKYVFIVQFGLDTGPTLRYKINDKVEFMDWFPNVEEPNILHDL